MASNKSSSKRQASLLAFVEKPSKHTRVMHSPPDNGKCFVQTANSQYFDYDRLSIFIDHVIKLNSCR